MNPVLKTFVINTLKKFDVSISRYGAFQQLMTDHSALQQMIAKNNRGADDMELLLTLPDQHSLQLLKYLPKSKSQLRQDLFVLSELEFKRNGYFVEFGATNGIELSNTYILEEEFEWNGILAEPAKCWHEDLKINRKCHIDTDCVWRD